MSEIDNVADGRRAGDAVSGRMLILFFALTFVISWICWTPTFFGVPDNLHLPFIILGGFGPFFSALIAIRVGKSHGGIRPWLKGMFNPRGVVLWILAGTILLPIGVGALHYGLYRGLGGPHDFSEAWTWYAYPIALVLTALFTGGNEEPGWRGFALPALAKRFEPIPASLILGVIHSAWHLPFMSHYETSFDMYLFNLVGLTFIFNWLYFKSRKCVIPVMMFHAGTNVIAEFFPTPVDVLDGTGTYMLLRGIVYWAIAIVLLIATRGRLGWRDRA
jgi:membrane protease YdiL (CAAX protease family)